MSNSSVANSSWKGLLSKTERRNGKVRKGGEAIKQRKEAWLFSRTRAIVSKVVEEGRAGKKAHRNSLDTSHRRKNETKIDIGEDD